MTETTGSDTDTDIGTAAAETEAKSAAKRLRDVPTLLAKAVRLLWQADHRTFALVTTLQVVSGAGLALQLLVGNRVLRVILAAGATRANANKGIDDVIPELLTLAAVTAVVGFAASSLAGYHRLLAERTIKHFERAILEVASAVDLEYYETPSFYDRLQRARQQGMMTPLRISLGLLGVTNALIGGAGIGAALAAIEPLLLPLVIIGYIPLWFVARRNSEEMYSFSFGQTPGDRLRQHLATSLAGREQAAETRAFDLSGFLLGHWDRSYGERLADVAAVVRRHVRRSLAGSTLTSILKAGVFGVLVWMLVTHRIDVAATATAAIAIQQLGSTLQRVGDDAAQLYESARYLEDYDDFVSLREYEREHQHDAPRTPATVEPFRTLTVDDLSFAYPSSHRRALERVSFELHAGEVVALVGENGSGKTTLAKLLAHLYEPTSGGILWDGVDTAELPPNAVRRHVAVIFQDFVRHRLSAADNIAMGDVERAHDLDAVRNAARAAGADGFLTQLADGYDTMLAKDLDGGADLSVGQWQRVALARAFFRDAPFIVLDEPTAALDAKAEYELFETVRHLAGGRTVLLISHRFSSVRSADRILVLHEGRLVEHGNHDELMDLGGRYAEMFTLQASQYV